MDLLGIIALVGLDQYTKYLAVIHLKDKPAYSIVIQPDPVDHISDGSCGNQTQKQVQKSVFLTVRRFLDKWISVALPALSRSYIQKCIKDEKVYVNDRPQKAMLRWKLLHTYPPH